MADRIVIMKDGDIQQIGTPEEVYNDPANVFVGGFIGSPPMNFFPAVLSENGMQIEEHSIQLPQDKIKAIKKLGFAGKQLIAGIRPEDIRLADANDETTFQATIDVSELLGSESILYTKIHDASLIIKTAPVHIKNGEQVHLAFDFDKLRFFNPETEKRIV